MPNNLSDPFASPLTASDRAVYELFAKLMKVKDVPSFSGPTTIPTPAQSGCEISRNASVAAVAPNVPDQPKKWGRLTPGNWNSREACRRDNVRCLFDLSPSTSPLPEFAGKKPAIEKSHGYPCSQILSVNEYWKYYGYDPKSSKTCGPETLRMRMERCVELRLRFPDDLNAIDMHELHCLRSDGLWGRFWNDFPAEAREMTIQLLCYEEKFTREQAEHHIAECEKTQARWKNEISRQEANSGT